MKEEKSSEKITPLTWIAATVALGLLVMVVYLWWSLLSVLLVMVVGLVALGVVFAFGGHIRDLTRFESTSSINYLPEYDRERLQSEYITDPRSSVFARAVDRLAPFSDNPHLALKRACRLKQRLLWLMITLVVTTGITYFLLGIWYAQQVPVWVRLHVLALSVVTIYVVSKVYGAMSDRVRLLRLHDQLVNG